MKYLYLIVAGMWSVFCTVCSCATGIGGDLAAQIIGNKSEPPVFLSCQAVSEKEINFRFSLPVKVVSLHFSPAITLDEVNGGDTVRVTFSDGPGAGQRLTADLLAEDEKGNTINVLVPLLTRNNRIPPLLINEIRTEYSKPKAEFIEFKTLQAGNLGALRLFVAGNFKAPLVYEFPSVEVATGEYITLHLRTTEETNRDELGRNLEESGGADSSPTARDLWIPGSSKLLHKTDVIYLLDQDDNVVDSVLLSESADPWWSKDYYAEAAEFLFKVGAWQSNGKICSPADAASSGGTTGTRTICRDETRKQSSGTADDWYITVNSGATPGKPNNPKRYN
ncbi:MAG: lamin tail domain-containing protein [Treponema sp.]|nr:lamin tail domain-containing protein [Treponema sp.]